MKHFLVFLLFLVAPVAAEGALYHGECRVSFAVRSTLHDFQGTGRCEPFIIRAADGSIAPPLLAVPVTSLDTDSRRRDKQMHKMFESEMFPLITGSTEDVILKDVLALFNGNDALPTEIVFDLSIRSITHQIRAAVVELHVGATELRAELRFDVSLAAYQLHPPSVLGIIRVNDTIEVTTSVLLHADQ
jgi:hypothetical protein